MTGLDGTGLWYDLHDYYLKPWRACATVAHSASMMCSYGSFNGLPDCLHGDYITDLIREKWDWTGFIVSNCGAIDNLTGPNYAERQGNLAMKAIGKKTEYKDLNRLLEVNGVGKGSQRATHQAIVPVHVKGA